MCSYGFVVISDKSVLTDLLDLNRETLVSNGPALSDGTDALDYAGFVDAAAGVAGALQRLGVQSGDRVGVHLHKTIHSFVAVHGALRAGAVMVPLDPFAPVEQLAAVITDADVAVLITDARAATFDQLVSLTGLTGAVVRSSAASDVIDVIRWDELPDIDRAPPLPVLPDDPAYIIYTSGSTGQPKGIVHTHRSALAYVRIAAAAYELRSDDRLANIAGLHFDQSTFELYVAPYVGCAVTVVPDAVLRFPASLSELVERERVTVWYSVPYVLRQLVSRGAIETRDLTSIRWILYGGESYPADELAGLMRALPGAKISNVYGPAEVNQCTRFDVNVPPVGDAPVPIGGAWAETELLVVDALDRPIVDGVGELLVATSTMMDRYWKRPDLTSAAIVERTFTGSFASRWYRTGDLVEADSRGDLVFLGRVDNQVKIRGQRVELEAIDLTIRQLESVAEVAAVVDTDESGERGVIAVVELQPDAELTLRELQRAVAERHPRVGVPVELVVVEALARTGTSKVDRNAALVQARASRFR